MIFTGLSENLTGRDTRTALKFLLLPWKWPKLRKGSGAFLAEEKLKKYFSKNHAFCFDSGRTALNYALTSLGVKSGDEVLVQAFTCVVVINAIKWAGAKPVFIDINDNFTIDPDDLTRKITPKSKVLIVQHTFGQPALLDRLLETVRKYNLKVIEDCAHSFGISYHKQLTGTFGDIGMLSFGSDKSLSCIRGGALITDKSEIAGKLKRLQRNLRQPSLCKVLQHLWHYPFFYIGRKLYDIKIGKIILAAGKKLNIINKIIYDEEKQGTKPKFYPAKLPHSLAKILLSQLNEVDKINEHRKKIVKFYNKNITISKPREDIAYLRYPILIKNPEKLIKIAKMNNIILGDWYNAVVAPKDINIASTGYLAGSCPHAEKLVSRVANLPTNRFITIKDAEKIINIINNAEYSS